MNFNEAWLLSPMKYICLQKKGIKYAFINSFRVKEMKYQEFKLYWIFAKLFSFSEKAIIIHFYYSFALHIPLRRMIQETLKLLVPEHAVPTWHCSGSRQYKQSHQCILKKRLAKTNTVAQNCTFSLWMLKFICIVIVSISAIKFHFFLASHKNLNICHLQTVQPIKMLVALLSIFD